MGIFACAQKVLVIADCVDYVVAGNTHYYFAKYSSGAVDLYYFLGR